MLQKSRMLQILGVKGEAVVTYREPLTTKEMRHHPAEAGRVNNMAHLFFFVDATNCGLHKRESFITYPRLFVAFVYPWHVAYGTLGIFVSF